MPLNREQILKARARTRPVQLPDLGEVLIRPMSVASLGRFMDSREALSAYQLYPLLASMSLCDEAGDLLFGEEDLDQLGEVGFDVLKALGDAILGLNKIEGEKGDDGQGDEAGESAQKKDSPTTPSGSGSLPLLSASA
jgi:hypothetical protein